MLPVKGVTRPVPVHEERTPRFLADAMLGRLARWLRMLGFDTIYAEDQAGVFDDHELLVQAVEDGRMLLTRDRSLGQNPAICLLRTEDVEQQLRELQEALGRPFTNVVRSADPRCSTCNGFLAKLLAPPVSYQPTATMITSYATPPPSPTPSLTPSPTPSLTPSPTPSTPPPPSPPPELASPPPELSLQIWERLPQGVKASQQDFWQCKTCEQVYWKGSHWVEIEKVRQRLIERTD